MQKNGMIGRKSERGQSFMELAVSVVFLLILLSAVIDLGWAYYTMTALRDTAQEAASYGTMCPNADKIRQRLLYSTTAPLEPSDIKSSDIAVELFDKNGDGPLPLYTNGDPVLPPDPTDSTKNVPIKGGGVHIAVKVDHQILTPFISTFIGTTVYPLRAEVSDTIMVDNCP